MSADWCVFNIGTGHASSEPDNILVRLHGSVAAGFINNGPGHKKGDLMGNVFGHGLGDRLESTMAGLPADARRVFLVGHSRGAILSYLIANEMKRQRSGIDVHIFNIDPVARYASGTDDKGVVQGNVRSVTALVMENDNAPGIGVGNMFQLTFVRAVANPGLPIEYIPMPGTHGTATQVNARNPVGRAAFQMALRWLDGHGVALTVQPEPPRTLCETFFEIHERNPVLGFTAAGGVAARAVTDWDKPSPEPKAQSSQNRAGMLAAAGISNPHSAGGGDKFTNAGLFINRYHSELFRACYPSSHPLVTSSATALRGLRITPGARDSIRSEVAVLKGYRCTWRTLTALGMADRLERAAAAPGPA
jgi:hypothetical protein